AEQTHGSAWDDPAGRHRRPRWWLAHLSLATARQHTAGALWQPRNCPCPAAHETPTERLSEEGSEPTCIRLMHGRDDQPGHDTGTPKTGRLQEGALGRRTRC